MQYKVVNERDLLGFNKECKMIDALFKCLKPYVDKKSGIVYSCGSCASCKRRKKQEWVIRCKHELITNNCKGTFFTLTYRPKDLKVTALKPENEYDKLGTLCREDFYKFFKRLRHLFPDRELRYFACGEYGALKWRPHYHVLLFGIDPEECEEAIRDKWKHGNVDISRLPVTEKVAAYIVGYVTKKMYESFKTSKDMVDYYKKNNREAPFLSCSKGLGGSWADKNVSLWLNSLTIGHQGKQVPVPRYYIIRQFRQEGVVRKVIHYDREDGTFYKQYKIVKNPLGPVTKKILSLLRERKENGLVRLREIKDKMDLPVDTIRAERLLKSFIENYNLSIISDWNYYQEDIYYFSEKLPPASFNSNKERGFFYGSEMRRISKKYAEQRFYNVTHGSGNSRELFDMAVDIMSPGG